MTGRLAAGGGVPGIIRLEDIRLHGHLGVTPAEQATGCDLLVTVELAVDLGRVLTTDQLADTVDYSAVYRLVAATVGERDQRLVESLAGRLAELVATAFPVTAATVAVRKLAPPVGGAAAAATAVVTRRWRDAWVGLGGNLGDRLAILRSAVAGLFGGPGCRLAAVSSLYETDPVGGPLQPPYYNAVAWLRTLAEPEQLLAVAHRLEEAAGRVRAERWGPRTLDVDLLVVDGEQRWGPDLILPHPRLTQRAFVLTPLAELAPGLLVAGRPVAELAAAVDGRGVRWLAGPAWAR